MDTSLQSRAEELAKVMAGEAKTVEDLNGLLRLMMKSAIERMLNAEMDVHLGRKGAAVTAAPDATGQLSVDGTKRRPNRRWRPIEEERAGQPGRSDDRYAPRP